MGETALLPEKLSRYVVVSDRAYQGADGAAVRIVYATRTGSAACLSEEVVDALRGNAFSSLDEETLVGLRAIQAIVPADEDERGQVLDFQRSACASDDALRFILLPTSYCNMGCSYCGQEHVRKSLGRDHRGAVLDRVLAGIAAPGTKSVAVSWFGSEPMIGYPTIRDLAPRFVAAARERGVSYGSIMVTNGTLLTTEKLYALINECLVTHFTITLDGPRRIHDTHRPLKNGRSSYRRIVETVQATLADPGLERAEFTLRTNIDMENSTWVHEYLDEMADLGFADDRVTFNLAPVYSWGNDVTGVEIPRRNYAMREIDWMEHMRLRGLRFGALPSKPVEKLCAAVTRSAEIVSSTGNVFSCSEYPLVPQHEATGGLGRVTEIDIHARRPAGPFDDWHDAIAAGETPCHDCTLMPVCGGGCPKQWREGRVPCPPMKYTMQERLDLVARISGLSVHG